MCSNPMAAVQLAMRAADEARRDTIRRGGDALSAHRRHVLTYRRVVSNLSAVTRQ